MPNEDVRVPNRLKWDQPMGTRCASYANFRTIDQGVEHLSTVKLQIIEHKHLNLVANVGFLYILEFVHSESADTLGINYFVNSQAYEIWNVPSEALPASRMLEYLVLKKL